MIQKKHKFVVLGGGTAGLMAATFLKTYWSDKIDLTLIYDHKNPGIGVGESLTPVFLNFLNSVNINISDLIVHANATIKLGLRFKNWTGDGTHFYHPFTQLVKEPDAYNYLLSTAMVDSEHFNNEQSNLYDSYYFDNYSVPFNGTSIIGKYSAHIDATLFARYLEERFKGQFEIIDNVVAGVMKDKRGHISRLICEDGEQVDGDFFIDASGFQRVLFKHLENKWHDMKDWLPLDRCIPNPVFTEFAKQPTCTTSEASEDGWILQVPLQNRWGSGYLYSSEFTSDEKAFDSFSKFVGRQYNKPLHNTSKVLKFDSGYWDKQWVGNCLSLGLSCGFSEPLEATNIHQVSQQLEWFTQTYNFATQEHDVDNYNEYNKKVFENIYLFLRFCYTNNKKYDSKFWNYINNNEPKKVMDVKNKISEEILNYYSLTSSTTFNHSNFTVVANGLGLIDKEKYAEVLDRRSVREYSRRVNEQTQTYKKNLQLQKAVDHLTLISQVKSGVLEINN